MDRLQDVELGAEAATPLLKNSSEESRSPSVLRPHRRPLQLIVTPQPSKSYKDIPNELWYLIFEFLSPPSITRPTHHTLVKVRGVCRLWRNVAERLIWRARRLVASPRLFDSPSDNGHPLHNLAPDIHVWLDKGFAHLVESKVRVSNRAKGIHNEDIRYGAEGGTKLRLVAFHLDKRYHPDQTLAKFFVSALSNCVRADVTIDHFPASVVPIPSYEITSPPSLPIIPLRQFSFSSMNLGINDTLPQQFDFPWSSLRQDLPWSQLTDISLDCVLSHDAALYVLSAALNAESVELGRLSSMSLPQIANPATSVIVSALRTLKINTSLDLQPLFSRLDLPELEDLQVTVYMDSTSTIPQNHIVDPGLNIPWQDLKRLSLRSDLTYRRCDLDNVLQQCHQLEHLKWDGDRSEFNHLPLGAPTHLQELSFTSDRAGHIHCCSNIDLFPDIIRLTLCYYHPVFTRSEHLSKLLHLTISRPITLVQLFLVLRCKAQCLLSGDFRLDSITRAVPESVRCDALQHLRLTLVDAFAFPWEKLHAPELRAFEIEIDGDSSSIRCRMEGFCSMHPDAIVSISPP